MWQRSDTAGWAKASPYYLTSAVAVLALLLSGCAPDSGDADASASHPEGTQVALAVAPAVTQAAPAVAPDAPQATPAAASAAAQAMSAATQVASAAAPAATLATPAAAPPATPATSAAAPAARQTTSAVTSAATHPTPAAGSATTQGAAAAAPAAAQSATPYYLEFRTRPYFSITHIFLTYGAQDAAGRPLERKTMGFYPQGGAFGPFIGIIGIAGVVGQEDYYAQMPSSTTFRRDLTPEQYHSLTSYVDAERGSTKVYNLIFNNCNDFVLGAAKAIGLKVPSISAVPPPMLIWLLAKMNT